MQPPHFSPANEMPADHHPLGASGVKEGANPERLEGQDPVNTTGDDDALDRGKVAFSTVWIPAEASQVIEAGPGQAYGISGP